MEKKRIFEVDLLRSVAVILMVIFHTIFTLSYFFGVDFPLQNPYWITFGQCIGALFLFLVGVSFALSSQKHQTYMSLWQCTLKRSAYLLVYAMIITGITYAIDPTSYIRFGILHCIAISILLLPLWKWMNKWNTYAGIIMLLKHYNRELPTVTNEWGVAFGLVPENFVSLDYYPLAPWFGFVLIGLGLGHMLFAQRQLGSLYVIDESFRAHVTWPGRHALIIYMVHQPVIFALLLLLGVHTW